MISVHINGYVETRGLEAASSAGIAPAANSADRMHG